MPKPKEMDERKYYNAIAGRIQAGRTRWGYDQADFAVTIGMCENTFRSRLEAPEKLTVRELRKISRVTKVPIETLITTNLDV